MPRNGGARMWETQCPACGELVGVVNTAWNRRRDHREVLIPKTSRHHAPDAPRWCPGGQMTVPKEAVMPGPAQSKETAA